MHVPAQVRAAALAGVADPAHRAVFHHHAVLRAKVGDVAADLHHLGGNLVAKGHRVPGPVADEIQIRSAHSAGHDLDHHALSPGGCNLTLPHLDVEELFTVDPFTFHAAP